MMTVRKKHLVRSFLICSTESCAMAGPDLSVDWGFHRDGRIKHGKGASHSFLHFAEIEVQLSALSSNKIIG